jgi:hypothetical protein
MKVKVWRISRAFVEVEVDAETLDKLAGNCSVEEYDKTRKEVIAMTSSDAFELWAVSWEFRWRDDENN